MSRFLKTRHYRLVLPGVRAYRNLNPNSIDTIIESIQKYLNDTGVSYTQEDVAEINLLYLRKYL